MLGSLRASLDGLLRRSPSPEPELVPRTSVHRTLHDATKTIHARFCTVQDKSGEKMMYSAIAQDGMSRLFISTDDTKTLDKIFDEIADEIASERTQFLEIRELTIKGAFSAGKLMIISNAFPNLTHLSIGLNLTDRDVSRALQMHFPQLEHLEVNEIDTDDLVLFLSQKLKLKTLSYTQRFGSFDSAQTRFFEDHPKLINIGPDKETFTLPVSLLKFLTDKHDPLETIEILKLEHLTSTDLAVLRTINWSKLPNLHTIVIDGNLNALQNLPATIRTLHIEAATDSQIKLPHNLSTLFPNLTHIIGDIEEPTIVSEKVCYQTSDREVYPWSGLNDSVVELQTTAALLDRYAIGDLAKLPHLATLGLHESFCTSTTAQANIQALLDACQSLEDMILMAKPVFDISSLTKNPLPIITIKEEHF